MKTLLFCLAALVAALFASMFVRALAKQRHDEQDWPFVSQEPLSQVEQILYHRLVHTLPDLVVLAQVPLSRFLRVKMGQTWREWQERIRPMTIDYLICDHDFAIIAAIDLGDRARDLMTRKKAEATINRALAAARVPLVHWRATELPSAQTIRSVFDEIRRDRYGDVGAVVPGLVEADLTASRIDASNDPTMFNEETLK